MTHSSSSLRAIGYALAGFTLWVLSDTCLKLLGDMQLPTYELMAISSIGGMSFIYAFVSVRRERSKLKPRRLSGLLMLGLLHLGNFSLWLAALPHLPLANLYTVTFLSPMMVAMLAAVFLRERISWKHALAIVAGFIGVTIAVDPAGILQHTREWRSYSYVFGSMLTISVQMLSLRIMGQREARECVAFYPRIVILIGSVAAGLFFGFKPMTGGAILLCFISGGIGSLGWLCMAHAYKMAPAAVVAPFHYSEILSGGLIGYLIWHDVPSTHLLIGALIIIGSGIYIITHSRKSAAILKEEESHA